MSDDNSNKDDKGFSFIQEQIASKKKHKFKRMLHSVAWTIMLAFIFGFVARLAFYVSEPTFIKILGKQPDKKTVEFPTLTPEEDNTIDKNSTDASEDENGIDDKQPDKNPVNTQPQTVIIETVVKADVKDLANIYSEIRSIANEVDKSLVTVTNISNSVDWFNNEYEATETTTGLVVANNGADLLMLVNLDKIEDAKNIWVTFSNGFQIEAKMQTYDRDLNLAVIAVSLEDIPKLNLNYIEPATLGESYSLVIGTPIIALGCPNGYVGSMEVGIISSKEFSLYITDNKIDMFNTDINYNENGDGVIVNLSGEVIGIITYKLKDEQNQQVNTVIGISRIKEIIESLVNNTDRIYFGIKGADMTEAALNKAEIGNGICVTEVEADSPALEAGLKSGDIILAVNDTLFNSVNTFYNLLTVYEPKDEVKITIQRSVKGTNKNMDIIVILGKKKG